MFVLDCDPHVAMVKTLIAVMRFTAWLDADAIERTIHEMTHRPGS